MQAQAAEGTRGYLFCIVVQPQAYLSWYTGWYFTPLGSAASDLLQNMVSDCHCQYVMAMSSATEITDAFMGHAGGCNNLCSVRKGRSTQRPQELRELLEFP